MARQYLVMELQYSYFRCFFHVSLVASSCCFVVYVFARERCEPHIRHCSTFSDFLKIIFGPNPEDLLTSKRESSFFTLKQKSRAFTVSSCS